MKDNKYINLKLLFKGDSTQNKLGFYFYNKALELLTLFQDIKETFIKFSTLDVQCVPTYNI